MCIYTLHIMWTTKMLHSHTIRVEWQCIRFFLIYQICVSLITKEKISMAQLIMIKVSLFMYSCYLAFYFPNHANYYFLFWWIWFFFLFFFFQLFCLGAASSVRTYYFPFFFSQDQFFFFFKMEDEEYSAKLHNFLFSSNQCDFKLINHIFWKVSIKVLHFQNCFNSSLNKIIVS